MDAVVLPSAAPPTQSSPSPEESAALVLAAAQYSQQLLATAAISPEPIPLTVQDRPMSHPVRLLPFGSTKTAKQSPRFNMLAHKIWYATLTDLLLLFPCRIGLQRSQSTLSGSQNPAQFATRLLRRELFGATRM